MIKTLYVHSYEEVRQLIMSALEVYLPQIENFTESFREHNIQLSVVPCYFYNGKFSTSNRQKGACVFVRVRLFPVGYSFAQAEKKYFSKKYFSHRIIEFTKTKGGYRVKIYPSKDTALHGFLEKILRRSMKIKTPEIALKENLGDVFRSVIFVDRYRSEVKNSLYGFDLHWILLIIALLLIVVNVHVHHEFLFH